MPEIVLTTLNARYAHAAFGLRYLLANLGALRERAGIMEFDISQRPVDVLEAILASEPKIVGIGIYIWNVTQATALVADLKRVRPQIIVVLGGPEVSHETGEQEIVRLADFVVSGEADLAFAELCARLLNVDAPNALPPASKVIVAPPPGFDRLALPYELYDAQDLAHRVVYVEASRGCPFRCEFCLSSLEVPVRNAPLEPFLAAMDRLMARGLRRFKFVDRTFNLNLNISRSILEFFWRRYEPGLFLHFEMIPDRLPEALRDPIKRFPPGALQFEVGIQSFNESVTERISRRQDNVKLAENLRFLRNETGVHVHADLIVGLPGEDLESFAAGFDRLIDLGPQEIQVGMLKRLRGTPIVRHDAQWRMVYSPTPPYEVLQTRVIDFSTMQRLRRFARFWDLMANSGNFVDTLPMLWEGAQDASPFHAFLAFSEHLYERAGRSHSIALLSLAQWLFEYLRERGHDMRSVAERLYRDYQRGGRSDVPDFLRGLVPEPARDARRRSIEARVPRRQARHLA